jgi:Predicted aspartyl protease
MYSYSDNRPIVPIHISPVFSPRIRHLKYALVDSGASISGITPSMVHEMALSPITKRNIVTVDGARPFNIYLVNIEFHGITFPALEVLGLGRDGTELIGRDILNTLHICLDGKQGMLEVI